jgi:hypothetical protein
MPITTIKDYYLTNAEIDILTQKTPPARRIEAKQQCTLLSCAKKFYCKLLALLFGFLEFVLF